MRVAIGVDPGIANIGVAYVKLVDGRYECVEADTIRTSPKLEESERMSSIAQAIALFFDRTNTNAILALEGQRGSIVGNMRLGLTNANALKTLEVLGLVRGLWIAMHGGPIMTIEPRDVRRIIGAKTKTGKRETDYRIREAVDGIKRVSSHAIDAVALAYVALRRANETPEAKEASRR